MSGDSSKLEAQNMESPVGQEDPPATGRPCSPVDVSDLQALDWAQQGNPCAADWNRPRMSINVMKH
ncbi:MAG: hypothetical protein ACYSUV_06695 [Planctomycetota bacterium]